MDQLLKTLFGFTLGVVASGQAFAQPITLTRVIDSNTTIPDSGGKKFWQATPFASVSLSEQRIAFRGEGPGLHGIYEWNSGTLIRVADTTTPVPSATGTFVGLGGWTNSGDHIVFGGNNGTVGGLYHRLSGSLSRVVDNQMNAPNGGKFSGGGNPSAEGASVAFYSTHGTGQNFAPSVYRWDNGTIVTVADTSTAVPGGTGSFSSFQNLTIHLDQGATWFQGVDGAGKSGLYRRNAQGLQAVIDTHTDGPAGMGKFLALVDLGVDGDNVILRGSTEIGNPIQGGLFTRINGQFLKIVSSGESAPGGSSFANFSALSIDSGVAVFNGELNSTNSAVFTNVGGTLQRIVGPGDMLDGKEVFSATLYPGGRDGNLVAMVVRFTDDAPFQGQFNQAIYLATLPAPGALLPFAGAAAWAARRSR